jgi:hypothetical protein
MLTPPHRIVHDPAVLPALRELLNQHRAMTQSGPETLARALYVLRYLPHRPEVFEIETALEALRVEDEVLA